MSNAVVNSFALGCGVVLGYLLKSWIKSESSSKPAEMLKRPEEDGVHDLKLVLVVQNGLKMGKGKIAAQCSHASIMAYQSSSIRTPGVLRKWARTGQRKIVVKVESEEEMLELASKSKAVGLIVSIVCDAGKTQVARGSKTVMAVGPDKEELLDSVTGHLKLL